MTQERTSALPATSTPTASAPAVRSGSTDVTMRTPTTSGVGGTTKIADSVVARIAGLATREVAGVHDMAATGAGGAFAGLTNRVTGSDPLDRGVAVQVGEIECIVDLTIVVDYGASIPQVSDAIRRNVSGRIGAMTGLQAKEVNISVTDLFFPDQGQPQQPPQPTVQ